MFQLGGNEPKNLAIAAKLCQDYGADEVNLNCGCPSSKVQRGNFGAILMKKPELVAECLKSMEKMVSIPVNVKCRLGVDNNDSYDFAYKFVQTISTRTNVKHFIIHARKC